MASVRTSVRVTADDWDANEAVRSVIAGAQNSLLRNPRAKASKLVATTMKKPSRVYYGDQTRIILTLQLDETVVRQDEPRA